MVLLTFASNPDLRADAETNYRGFKMAGHSQDVSAFFAALPSWGTPEIDWLDEIVTFPRANEHDLAGGPVVSPRERDVWPVYGARVAAAQADLVIQLVEETDPADDAVIRATLHAHEMVVGQRPVTHGSFLRKHGL